MAGMGGCGGGATPIYDWYQLSNVRNNLGGNYILMNDLDSNSTGYFIVAYPGPANGGNGWDPIGGADELFTGTFDGQGYEIRDFVINRPARDRVGLFGAFDWRAVVKNLGVANATVTGSWKVGGLVGEDNGAPVSNCYFTGSVTGQADVGGLIGWNYGIVSDSSSTGSVTGGSYVGCLVGENWHTVSNSSSTGNVTGGSIAGGLVGRNSGTVSNSYSRGNVTGGSTVGGLLGSNYDGIVSNSHYNYDEVMINGQSIITVGALFDEDFEEWLANNKFLDVNERLSQESGYYAINNVSDFKQLLAFGQNGLNFRLKNDLDLATEPNFYIPYLAGKFDGNGHNISNLSFNFDFASQVGLFGYLVSGGKVTDVAAENVNITGDSCVGGLVGTNHHGTVGDSYVTGSVTGDDSLGGLLGNNDYGTVSDSYSSASVTGNMYVGGLVGANSGNVSTSYSTGSVTGNDSVGGLVGGNSTGTVTVSNSFWDTQTSGQTTSAGGTGKTTAEMQDIATFSGATWDITAVANPDIRNLAYIWNIVDNVTYPFLSWKP